MDSIYVSIGKHMKEYRLSRNLTQQEVADRIAVSGNYYGKVERGAYSLSFNVLSYLYKEFGWDIDYILTGNEKEDNPFQKIIDQCQDHRKNDLIALILWTLNLKLDTLAGLSVKQINEYRQKLNVTRQCYEQIIWNSDLGENDEEDQVAEERVLYQIRKSHALSNETMAEKLNLTPRSYESLEKGRSKPGVETFVWMDRRFGYNPSFVMTGDFVNLTAVNEIWQQFSKEIQKEIMQFLSEANHLM